jgi:glycerophosphoryl diester phosphodiesterase
MRQSKSKARSKSIDVNFDVTRSGPDWLVARPIAHRGLHDAKSGIVENTASAIEAAIEGGYGIEVDLQATRDGDAVVHHDAALGRITDGKGRIDALTVEELKRVAFRTTQDRMLTIGELCELVAGRATLLLELKTNADFNRRVMTRVAQVLATYPGPAAVMSFDPALVGMARAIAPGLVRGLVAQRRRSTADIGVRGGNTANAYWRELAAAAPQFLAYSVADLPGVVPWLARSVLRIPLLTWTVRNERERRVACRWADQMIFEGFRP